LGEKPKQRRQEAARRRARAPAEARVTGSLNLPGSKAPKATCG
jgi:hypothetical protein